LDASEAAAANALARGDRYGELDRDDRRARQLDGSIASGVEAGLARPNTCVYASHGLCLGSQRPGGGRRSTLVAYDPIGGTVTVKATWEPHEKHGHLTTQSDLPDSVFAFPGERKEPLTDAQHVRNAVARFDQVIDVSDADRELAFANIEKAADYYDVKLSETAWHQLGVHPQKERKAAAAKGAATRRAHAEERTS
jgi:hypothetical protein